MSDTTAYFNVGHVPYRKKTALSVIRGTEVEVLAYFVSDEAADEFCTLMGVGK